MSYKPWMMVVNMVTSISLVDMEERCDDSFDLTPLEEKKGHPLPCSSGCCTSQLYILRAAAVHYPILRTLLNNIISC